jgi:hypothetical protein
MDPSTVHFGNISSKDLVRNIEKMLKEQNVRYEHFEVTIRSNMPDDLFLIICTEIPMQTDEIKLGLERGYSYQHTRYIYTRRANKMFEKICKLWKKPDSKEN